MSTTILSKFQGALVGAVIGDCIGAVFEHLWAETISPDKVKAAVERVEAGEVRVIFIKREKKRGRGMFCSNTLIDFHSTMSHKQEVL
jgi:ADP-ribosylglycohydrolase